MKNQTRRLAFSCLLMAVAFVFFTAGFSQISDTKNHNERFVHVRISKEITGKLNIGMGWNNATVLEGRWLKHDFSREDWDRYFGLMEWSGCHWLRHAVTITDWEPFNENQDPEETDWDGFTFNSENMNRHYTFLDQAEKRGIKVLLTNWRLGARWLTSQDEKWILAHPDNEDEFAESLAALVYYLKRIKKYQCVWALSLWNEPNGDWAYIGPESDYPDSFWPLYLSVDKHLRRLGVRDEILLLGPDTSTGGKPEHIIEMLEKYGYILDIISDHDYSAFRGERMDMSIRSYGNLIADLNEITEKELPFVIGEFGNYGAGSQAVDDDERVYSGAMSTVAYLMRMINQGASGLARWEFHLYGDTWRNFGALTETDPDYIFKPYGPVYYPHAITSRYVRPGWEVRKTEIRGVNDDICASALTSAENDITIMMLNDGKEERYVFLETDITLRNTILHHMSVTGPLPDGIKLHENIIFNQSGITIKLLPGSVTTLTSLPVGDLEIPHKLALKR